MDDPKQPRPDDRDFLDRLSDLDRNLSISGEPATATDAWDGFAERRRSSAAAPRGPRPLLDLFPPVEPVLEPAEPAGTPDDDVFAAPEEEHFDESESPRRLAGLAATFLIAMAAGATAAAYLFRDDLAAIIAAWQR